MKRTIFLFSLLVILANPHSVFAQNSVPYPAPPSDEQKEAWKKAGDENLRKYGSGSGVSPTAKQLKATPTASASATLTKGSEQNNEASAAAEQMKQGMEQEQQQEKNLFRKVWQWVKSWFGKKN